MCKERAEEDRFSQSPTVLLVQADDTRTLVCTYKVLKSLKNMFSIKPEMTLIYSDDILIFSQIVTNHMAQGEPVLSFLENVEIILKLKKCLFFLAKVNYVRHVPHVGCFGSRRRNKKAHSGNRVPINAHVDLFLGF